MPIEGPAIEHAADKRAREFNEIMNRTPEERERVALNADMKKKMINIKKKKIH